MATYDDDSLKLKAAVEFGSDYIYDVRNGTMGRTLYVKAGTKEKARHIRKKIQSPWEGVYVIVLYSSAPELTSSTEPLCPLKPV